MALGSTFNITNISTARYSCFSILSLNPSLFNISEVLSLAWLPCWSFRYKNNKFGFFLTIGLQLLNNLLSKNFIVYKCFYSNIQNFFKTEFDIFQLWPLGNPVLYSRGLYLTLIQCRLSKQLLLCESHNYFSTYSVMPLTKTVLCLSPLF